MSIDAQAVQHGISQAEAWVTMLGALGVWKGLEIGLGWVQRHRKAKQDAEAKRVGDEAARVQAAVDEAKAALAKEQKLQTAETMQARQIRRDTVDEWQQIADERKVEAHDCAQRLDVAEGRLDECDKERKALRSEVESLKGRMTKVEENGHGSSN